MLLAAFMMFFVAMCLFCGVASLLIETVVERKIKNQKKEENCLPVRQCPLCGTYFYSEDLAVVRP